MALCARGQAIAIPIPGGGGEIFDDNGTIPILFGLFCTISQSPFLTLSFLRLST